MTPLDEEMAGRIRRHGPLPFAEIMNAALYHPEHGFYGSGGAAGRRGDFITSPEVGPLFGAVLAHALDTWWDELGRPVPFVVIEAGAGVGTLARSILAAAPRCLPALTYVLVEQSPGLRTRQSAHLSLADPASALPVARLGDLDDGDGDVATHDGPVFVSLPELPVGPFTGVVLANELLDNLPVALLAYDRGRWHEVRAALAADDVTLVELLVPATDALAERAAHLVSQAPDGCRIPIALGATEWLRKARACLDRGRMLMIDYADVTPSLATRPATDWLRTYRGHERGSDPLDALGTQDITCEVPEDQIRALLGVDRTAVDTQAEFLRRHGIDTLVEEGRRIWKERAHLGDLTAMKARSRVREAEALTEPAGLGAFRVFTSVVG